MTLAVVYSRAKLGVDAPLVTVEVHLSAGLPSFSIVGLPEATVKESKDRVRSALMNAHFEFPVRRITVNLAPADLPKSGGRFDLPIALGILAASGQVPLDSLSDIEFLGELGLSGELREVSASLPAAIYSSADTRALVVPKGNSSEAALARGSTVFGAESLPEVCAHLLGREKLQAAEPPPLVESFSGMDLSDVKGQAAARRALEITAAGGHNLLFTGPPGTGKTLLASRLPGILPPLTDEELLSTAAVASVAGKADTAISRQRPFRAPHHTASAIALVGGGGQPKPGEISLAHNGVLFLDELPEFPRRTLDVLREPLESGEVTISRAAHQVCYPSKFQLVAAMNPCPCGFSGDPDKNCRCTPDQIQRYVGRLSGPLLDRIDIKLNVPRLPTGALRDAKAGESSAIVRERVLAARAIQQQRAGCTNAEMSLNQLEQFCKLDESCEKLMQQAEQRMGLSGRAQHRVLRVARTIADLVGADSITVAHLSEAISYRG